MVMEFVNRRTELEELRALLRQREPVMIRLYGRRRLGKTELLKILCRDEGGLYLLVDEASVQEQRASLARQVQEQVGGERPVYPDWDSLFRHLLEIGKSPAVLDEVQRLYDSDPSAFSRLQDHWDSGMRRSGPSLILCGSSIGMMRRFTRRKSAPLFGRLAGDLRLRPLGFAAARLFYPRMPERERIVRYAVFGGTPYYHRFSEGRTIEQAVRTAFLRPVAPLLDEPENLLRLEVRQPARYNSILREIGTGTHDLRELETKVGARSGRLSPYIATLRDGMDLVRSEEPVCGVRRRARYVLSDPFFSFYYRFIFEARPLLELGAEDDAWARIAAGLDAHAGAWFEQVVRETLIFCRGKQLSGARIEFDRIGRWWNRIGEEIDVVAAGEKNLIAGEAKWSATKVTRGTLDRLEEKVRMIERRGARPVRLLLATAGNLDPKVRSYAIGKRAIVLEIGTISRVMDAAARS
jgi:hypothetical protein